VENAYWTLVFARQDLDVRNEALKLAEELLKLNQIKVQVGTLPPIDITQAEAGVASREEDVIIADAAIQSAQDRLRRVMGMDPNSPEWRLPIVPTEDLTIVDRPVDLQESIKTAIDNRPDLAQSRLTINSADADLAFRRNQLKYSLDGRADYILQGLSGDTNPFPVSDPADPNLLLGVVPPVNAGIQDTFDFLVNRDFPTYELRLTLGIPIGNRAAKALYSRSRLTREQASIAYSTTEQAAIVQVSNAVRRVVTDRKRIDAAEKNRVLQERKVEAEQKKFENGLSTSFQVLTFQSDLAEARSRENQARTDYRISMAALDQITGILDRTLDIRLDDYPAH
jgi:outer membrane protein TolC